MAITDSSIVNIEYMAIRTSIGNMIFPHIYVNDRERGFVNNVVIDRPIAVQAVTSSPRERLEGNIYNYHSTAGEPDSSLIVTFPDIAGLELRLSCGTSTYKNEWYYNNTRTIYNNPRVDFAAAIGFYIITDVNNMTTPGIIYGYVSPVAGNPVIISDYPSASKFGTFLGQSTGYGGTDNSSTQAQLMAAAILGQSIPAADVGDEDPYDPGGNTEPGGGEGDFDDTTEDVDFPDDPSLSAVDTGFLTLFNPTISQLNALANFMWGSVFDIENWKKIFANPMDAILGLSMVPVSVPDGGSGTVKVGNIDTGVSMTKAAKQYVNVDCGTLNIKEYWGAYLDYSPYTKAEIFLPFIGTHEISVDDVMKKAVHVKYKVDILSGACVANIKCGGSVLYSFSGQCAATIPITGRDWTQTLSAALSVAGNVLSVAASQGMTAPMAATSIAQSAVNAIKPNIQKTGSIGGMAGIMGIQKPYIILTRPRQAIPKNQNKYTGYPSFITVKLSKCDGYTEVEKIHLDSTSATQVEIKELETLLDKGVIF